MRRLWPACVVGLAALGAAAPARADVFDTYQRLATRNLTPAPLVFTTGPGPFRSLDGNIQGGPGVRRGSYSVRLVHYTPAGPNAIIALTRGQYHGLRRAARAEGSGYRRRRTRIRGHRGYLLTRRRDPAGRIMLWREDGQVYEMSSGTPRKVKLGHMRAAAAGLDHLRRDYIGSSPDPNSSSEGYGVVTDRTVTLTVDFDAQCTTPGFPGTTQRGGQTSVVLLQRSGNSFSWDIAQHHRPGDPWAGRVTGTVSPTAITVSLHASGTIEGEICDSGPLTLTLADRFR